MRGVTFKIFGFIVVAAIAFASTKSFAGITIDGVEFGVGKFHRYDNKVHPYGQNNAWTPFILPDGATVDKLLVVRNTDGSYSVFFRTLDEFLSSVVQIAQKAHQPVSVLNINAHGIYGLQAFPPDEKTMNSSGCSDWRQEANGPDEDNYTQYYSPLSIQEIIEIRNAANWDANPVPCASGLSDWQNAVATNPAIVQVMDPNIQIHFLSCIVGLGTIGSQFTTGIAKLFLHGPLGRVVTLTNYGLGDWSMPEGMGFWDYFTPSQVEHDNAIYPVDREDREIMKPGTLRISILQNGQIETGLEPNQEFLHLGYDRGPVHLLKDTGS